MPTLRWPKLPAGRQKKVEQKQRRRRRRKSFVGFALFARIEDWFLGVLGWMPTLRCPKLPARMQKVEHKQRRRNLKIPDEIWMFFQLQNLDCNFGIFGALKNVGVLQYSCSVFWQHFGQIVAWAFLTLFFGTCVAWFRCVLGWIPTLRWPKLPATMQKSRADTEAV